MKRLELQNPRLFAVERQKKNAERIFNDEAGFTRALHPDEIYRRTGRSTVQAVEIVEYALNGQSVLVKCGSLGWNYTIWKGFQKTVADMLAMLGGEQATVTFGSFGAETVGITADVTVTTRDLYDNLPTWVWALTTEDWDKCSTTSITEVCRRGNWLRREAEFSIKFDGITQESYTVELAEFNKYVSSRRKALGCERFNKEGVKLFLGLDVNLPNESQL